jgi:hypothetical protein
MDEIVKKAIQKWPDVPACYGWLGLDSRGDWFLRDDQVQRIGNFDVSKGTKLSHRKLIEFIGRNYQQDDRGQYFFQNGPQKVFVELELTPWVLRFDFETRVVTQTQQHVITTQAYTDELGRVYLETELGIGLVHTMDMDLMADELAKERWSLKELKVKELEEKFNFIKSPSHEKSQSRVV